MRAFYPLCAVMNFAMSLVPETMYALLHPRKVLVKFGAKVDIDSAFCPQKFAVLPSSFFLVLL